MKAIIRRGVEPNRAQAAAGATFLLWCYVANHGKGEPGLGLRADGTALSMAEMASECLFDSEDALVDLLDYMAGLGHVHQAIWQQKRIVFLPAMWERVSAYYRGKARKMNYQTAQEVVAAVLDGTIRDHLGHAGAGKALPTKPTNQPNKQDPQREGGPDLFSDTGPDQVEAVVQLWNTERRPGPHIAKAGSRAAGIRKVLKDYPNLEDWRTVIRYINRQQWCNAPGTGTHPTFRMGMDTLVRPGQFQKLLEQAATDKGAASPDGVVGRDNSKGRTGRRPGEFAEALRESGE